MTPGASRRCSLLAGERRRRRGDRRRQRQGLRRSLDSRGGRLREDLFGALDALPGLQPFPGAANFLLVRGPDGLPERLARRGVLVRGCGPFYGLGPEFFRVAVRSVEENGRLVAAIKEEL